MEPIEGFLQVLDSIQVLRTGRHGFEGVRFILLILKLMLLSWFLYELHRLISWVVTQ